MPVVHIGKCLILENTIRSLLACLLYLPDFAAARRPPEREERKMGRNAKRDDQTRTLSRSAGKQKPFFG